MPTSQVTYSWAEVSATNRKKNCWLSREKIVLYLYGLKRYSTLNEARHYRFLALTKKSTLRSDFDLAKLNPTSEACHQHLLRVFLLVQKCLGNKLPVIEWGGRVETAKQNGSFKTTLKPITSFKPFSPDDLLHQLSCACKKGCGSYCGCKKAKLVCSPKCEHCSGLSCLNSPIYSEEDSVPPSSVE
ncbi:hypothetical protein AVEN_136241-1 [Araneus ventricosus]|nr:hypothetical protein AVEN_3021-1 [Araneus ventricosus]GBO16466.1 hypothetical protein AVEN_158521-1 [Araneus ventricosus]GBO23389.1 hypothetical protein AVEN_136241-1 [Araneus ventricosus]